MAITNLGRDGSDYPDQLKEKAIPLGARIITVIDAYTAMIAERSYQRARSSEEALPELRRCAGEQFDPAVVEARAERLQEQLDQQQADYAASWICPRDAQQATSKLAAERKRNLSLRRRSLYL